MVERRDVELLIRAKDLSTRPLRDVSAAIDRVSASLGKQVEAARKGEVSYQELASTFREVETAGRALAQQQGLLDRFAKLGSESARLADRVRNASVALRDFRDGLSGSDAVTTKQAASLRRLETEYSRSQAAFAKNQASLNTLQTSLEAAGLDTKNLATTQAQVVASANQAGQALTTLSTATAAYATNAREAADANRKMQASQRANESLAEAQSIANTARAPRGRSDSFAASIQDIADPAAAARRTLVGLESSVESLGAEIAKINGPVRNYAENLLLLSAAQKSAENIGRLIDNFRQQTVALRDSRAAYAAARADVRAYQQQVAATNRPSDDLVRKLREAQTALRGAAVQFAANANAARQTREQLREASVDTARLDEAQKRLTATVTASAAATKRLQDGFAQFGSAGRGGVGIFGLSPYAVQNLGFQINDFFTQIASGTSVTQAFAQQFGQVVQVFGPGSFTAIARFIPLIASLGATIGLTIGALSRLNATAQSTRNFQARLDISGGGSGLSAERLTAITREIEKIGVGFDEARTAVVSFLNAGVISGGLREATEIAVRYARITGQDIPAATQLFIRGLTEGRDGFNALLQAQVNFSDATRQTITALLDQGRAGEAQRVIIDALRESYRAADQQGISPFRQAAIDVKNAWKGVLDELGKTGILQALERGLRSLAERGQQLAGVFRQLRGEAAAAQGEATPQQVAAGARQTAEQRLGTAERRVQEGSSIFRFGSAAEVEAARAALPGLRAEVARLRQEEEAVTRAQQNGLRIQAERGDADAERVRTTALRAQLDATERLVREQERQALIADKSANAEARRDAVRAQARARVLAIAPAAGDSAEGRAQIARAEAADIREFNQRLQQELESGGRGAAAAVRRDFQAIRTDITETLRVRDEAVRGIQEDVAAGALTPTEAIQAIQQAADQARPALQRLAQEARAFRDAQGGGDAVRRAALDGLVAQAERQAGAGGSRAGVRQVITGQQSEVQRLVQERQQFVQTQDSLVNQNAVTQTDSEQQIAQFYAETNDELVRQIGLLQESAEAARANGDISDAAFRQISASVSLYTANLQRVDPAITRLKNSIEQGFVQSISTAFNTGAEAFGNFIAGVGSLEEAFDTAGKAAVQFFADFLKAIAQAIIQQQALVAIKIISASIGAFHSGGVIGRDSGTPRAANPAWFANAPRYHSGGVVGLRPNEQAAILERGEEVLAKDDPRNIMNAGGRSAPAAAPTSVRNVLAVGDSEIANAMAGPPGEQVIMNTLKRNIVTVRSLIR